MNKRQRSILTGRRPPRRVSSVKPVDERFGPSPLRLMYHRMQMDVVLRQLSEAYEKMAMEYILSGFGVPAHLIEDK